MYFVLLNIDNNYFTLLEINEREKTIYYYNSITSKDIINDKMKTSCVGRMIQVS